MLLYLIIAIVYFFIFILYAQYIAPQDYSCTINTIDELCSQNYENRTIMAWGYRGFGIILILGILLNYQAELNHLHYTIPLFLYAIGMFWGGTFGGKPFQELVFYKKKEITLHNLGLQISNFALGVLVFMKFITGVGIFNRVLNALVLIVILYSSIQGNSENEKRGIYQRVMYFVTFMWLIYAYSGMM